MSFRKPIYVTVTWKEALLDTRPVQTSAVGDPSVITFKGFFLTIRKAVSMLCNYPWLPDMKLFLLLLKTYVHQSLLHTPVDFNSQKKT